ncbi:toxin glutamine deamidase domain-containing protein [Hamadaea sp. NPDC051192]|uniref:WXG100-like domain-containing protein n=1 Tax=Hamadaea sp. NPDC051192 TaxID=3154940 RepID=UPI003419FF18
MIELWDFGEPWNSVRDALIWLGSGGSGWPEANEDQIRTLAQAWQSVGERLQSGLAEANGAAADLMAAWGGDGGSTFAEQWQTLGVQLPQQLVDIILNGVDGNPGLAQSLEDAALNIEYDKISTLIEVAVVIIEIFVILVTAWIAFWAAWGAAAARIAVGRAAIWSIMRELIAHAAASFGQRGLREALLQSLKQWAKTTLKWEVAKEIGAETGVDITAQLVQFGKGTRHEWDVKKTVSSGLGGAAGAVLSFASPIGEHIAGGITSKVGKTAVNLGTRGLDEFITEIGAETIANGVVYGNWGVNLGNLGNRIGSGVVRDYTSEKADLSGRALDIAKATVGLETRTQAAANEARQAAQNAASEAEAAAQQAHQQATQARQAAATATRQAQAAQQRADDANAAAQAAVLRHGADSVQAREAATAAQTATRQAEIAQRGATQATAAAQQAEDAAKHADTAAQQARSVADRITPPAAEPETPPSTDETRTSPPGTQPEGTPSTPAQPGDTGAPPPSTQPEGAPPVPSDTQPEGAPPVTPDAQPEPEGGPSAPPANGSGGVPAVAPAGGSQDAPTVPPGSQPSPESRDGGLAPTAPHGDQGGTQTVPAGPDTQPRSDLDGTGSTEATGPDVLPTTYAAMPVAPMSTLTMRSGTAPTTNVPQANVPAASMSTGDGTSTGRTDTTGVSPGAPTRANTAQGQPTAEATRTTELPARTSGPRGRRKPGDTDERTDTDGRTDAEERTDTDERTDRDEGAEPDDTAGARKQPDTGGRADVEGVAKPERRLGAAATIALAQVVLDAAVQAQAAAHIATRANAVARTLASPDGQVQITGPTSLSLTGEENPDSRDDPDATRSGEVRLGRGVPVGDTRLDGEVPASRADVQRLISLLPTDANGRPLLYPNPRDLWVQHLNDGGSTVPGRATNCDSGINAFLSTFFGHPAVAAATVGRVGVPAQRSEDWAGTPHTRLSDGVAGLTEVEAALVSIAAGLTSGQGAVASIIARPPGSAVAHRYALTVVVEDGQPQLTYVDVQTGTVYAVELGERPPITLSTEIFVFTLDQTAQPVPISSDATQPDVRLGYALVAGLPGTTGPVSPADANVALGQVTAVLQAISDFPTSETARRLLLSAVLPALQGVTAAVQSGATVDVQTSMAALDRALAAVSADLADGVRRDQDANAQLDNHLTELGDRGLPAEVGTALRNAARGALDADAALRMLAADPSALLNRIGDIAPLAAARQQAREFAAAMAVAADGVLAAESTMTSAETTLARDLVTGVDPALLDPIAANGPVAETAHHTAVSEIGAARTTQELAATTQNLAAAVTPLADAVAAWVDAAATHDATQFLTAAVITLGGLRYGEELSAPAALRVSGLVVPEIRALAALIRSGQASATELDDQVAAVVAAIYRLPARTTRRVILALEEHRHDAEELATAADLIADAFAGPAAAPLSPLGLLQEAASESRMDDAAVAPSLADSPGDRAGRRRELEQLTQHAVRATGQRHALRSLATLLAITYAALTEADRVVSEVEAAEDRLRELFGAVPPAVAADLAARRQAVQDATRQVLDLVRQPGGRRALTNAIGPLTSLTGELDDAVQEAAAIPDLASRARSAISAAATVRADIRSGLVSPTEASRLSPEAVAARQAVAATLAPTVAALDRQSAEVRTRLDGLADALLDPDPDTRVDALVQLDQAVSELENGHHTISAILPGARNTADARALAVTRAAELEAAVRQVAPQLTGRWGPGRVEIRNGELVVEFRPASWRTGAGTRFSVRVTFGATSDGVAYQATTASHASISNASVTSTSVVEISTELAGDPRLAEVVAHALTDAASEVYHVQRRRWAKLDARAKARRYARRTARDDSMLSRLAAAFSYGRQADLVTPDPTATPAQRRARQEVAAADSVTRMLAEMGLLTDQSGNPVRRRALKRWWKGRTASQREQIAARVLDTRARPNQADVRQRAARAATTLARRDGTAFIVGSTAVTQGGRVIGLRVTLPPLHPGQARREITVGLAVSPGSRRLGLTAADRHAAVRLDVQPDGTIRLSLREDAADTVIDIEMAAALAELAFTQTPRPDGTAQRDEDADRLAARAAAEVDEIARLLLAAEPMLQTALRDRLMTIQMLLSQGVPQTAAVAEVRAVIQNLLDQDARTIFRYGRLTRLKQGMWGPPDASTVSIVFHLARRAVTATAATQSAYDVNPEVGRTPDQSLMSAVRSATREPVQGTADKRSAATRAAQQDPPELKSAGEKPKRRAWKPKKPGSRQAAAEAGSGCDSRRRHQLPRSGAAGSVRCGWSAADQDGAGAGGRDHGLRLRPGRGRLSPGQPGEDGRRPDEARDQPRPRHPAQCAGQDAGSGAQGTARAAYRGRRALAAGAGRAAGSLAATAYGAARRAPRDAGRGRRQDGRHEVAPPVQGGLRASSPGQPHDRRPGSHLHIARARLPRRDAATRNQPDAYRAAARYHRGPVDLAPGGDHRAGQARQGPARPVRVRGRRRREQHHLGLDLRHQPQHAQAARGRRHPGARSLGRPACGRGRLAPDRRPGTRADRPDAGRAHPAPAPDRPPARGADDARRHAGRDPPAHRGHGPRPGQRGVRPDAAGDQARLVDGGPSPHVRRRRDRSRRAQGHPRDRRPETDHERGTRAGRARRR